MRKFAFVLAAVLGLSVSALAQDVTVQVSKGTAAVRATSGTTGYNPILIKYVGLTPVGGTVTVDAATGDITLKTGPVAGSTADLTTECPVSGALGGVIDVSNAACNTLGEVVDAINASANWRAVIQDGIRSDSSDNTLTTLAETSASVPNGLALAGDSTISLNVTLLVTGQRNDITQYIGGAPAFAINPNPFNLTRSGVIVANATNTLTGADTKKIIFSTPTNKRCSLTASAVVCSATEDISTYSAPGGGTTVNSAFDFSNFALLGSPGQRVLFRADAATTLTAVTIASVAGVQFKQ